MRMRMYYEFISKGNFNRMKRPQHYPKNGSQNKIAQGQFNVVL